MSEIMNNVNGRAHWVIKKQYIGTGVQEPIALPFEPKGYTICASPAGGSCRVEASIDDDMLLWDAWTVGNVTATTTQGIMFPIKYLRVVNETASSSEVIVWGY